MSFGLKLRNTPKDEIQSRVKRAADILHVAPYLSRYPRQLSGGQRQRVAMGRAIVRDPQVFLFDEPLSNLDAQLRVQMRAEIKELHQRLKTTTIYVTHDQIEAMTMADRIVVMRDGVVEQMGAPLELYDRPATLFVASFIGSPSMNLLKGSVTVKGKLAFVTEAGVELPLKAAPSNIDGRPCIYGIGQNTWPLAATSRPRFRWSSRPARKPRSSPRSEATRSSPSSGTAYLLSRARPCCSRRIWMRSTCSTPKAASGCNSCGGRHLRASCVTN